MDTHLWQEVLRLEPLVRKALVRATAYEEIKPEDKQDLMSEATLAAYGALKTYDPNRSSLETWVFHCVHQHIRRILTRYRQLETTDEEQFTEPDTVSEGQNGLDPLRLAVLLATAPPSERVYILYELFDWERPPPYVKSRLAKRWTDSPWVRLLTDHARGSDRCQMIHHLCWLAGQGSPRQREIAGFALASIARQIPPEVSSSVRAAAHTLTDSPDPVHQLAGLWILHGLEPQPWDRSWLRSLSISALGSVLESRYSRAHHLECPCPLCHHFYPDVTRRRPTPQLCADVLDAFCTFLKEAQEQGDWESRWRCRLLAKAMGFFGRLDRSVVMDACTAPSGRLAESLIAVSLARIDPTTALQQADGWLPSGPSGPDRIWRAARSRDPMQRSSALYVARGLDPDILRPLVITGFQDPLVFVRFSALRPMDHPSFFPLMEKEFFSPHRHKRLFHRCLLNTMARGDFEKTIPIAVSVYLGATKEEWREDSWLRHDAGFILRKAYQDCRQTELATVFRTVLEKESHPSPFVLLPAVQALQEHTL